MFYISRFPVYLIFNIISLSTLDFIFLALIWLVRSICFLLSLWFRKFDLSLYFLSCSPHFLYAVLLLYFFSIDLGCCGYWLLLVHDKFTVMFFRYLPL